MKYGRVPGVNKEISRLVQGAGMLGTSDLDKSFALLDWVYELGGNTFDTAHVYGRGEPERALGQWIKARGNRDKVVILSKGAHMNEDRRRVTPYDITSDLHDSLARMQVDYVDLYILHRDDPSVPVGPIVEVLNEHARAGLIGAFGGSNWSAERVKEANEYAKAHNLTPFMSSSPQFSLAEQLDAPWEECLSVGGPKGEKSRDWYQQEQIALFPWSSLAGGFFSGRFRRDNLDQQKGYFEEMCVRCYCSEDNFKRLDRAEQLGKEKGATLAQIAMAYVVGQPLNIFPLVGCVTRAEFAACAEALEIALTPQELAWLDLRADSSK